MTNAGAIASCGSDVIAARLCDEVPKRNPVERGASHCWQASQGRKKDQVGVYTTKISCQNLRLGSESERFNVWPTFSQASLNWRSLHGGFLAVDNLSSGSVVWTDTKPSSLKTSSR